MTVQPTFSFSRSAFCITKLPIILRCYSITNEFFIFYKAKMLESKLSGLFWYLFAWLSSIFFSASNKFKELEPKLHILNLTNWQGKLLLPNNTVSVNMKNAIIEMYSRLLHNNYPFNFSKIAFLYYSLMKSFMGCFKWKHNMQYYGIGIHIYSITQYLKKLI